MKITMKLFLVLLQFILITSRCWGMLEDSLHLEDQQRQLSLSDLMSEAASGAEKLLVVSEYEQKRSTPPSCPLPAVGQMISRTILPLPAVSGRITSLTI